MQAVRTLRIPVTGRAAETMAPVAPVAPSICGLQVAEVRMNTGMNEPPTIVYWHRELPPLEAQPVAEHTVEATSGRVPDTIAHRDDLWNQCRDDLMVHACARLADEVSRLGGRYAHVLTESIDPRHDVATGETWLHGRFTYMLYR